MGRRLAAFVLLAATCLGLVVPPRRRAGRSVCVRAEKSEDYVNPVTELLGQFIPKQEDVVIDGVDFSAPKTPLAPARMRDALDRGLREREWFVTGRVLPELFADDFEFRDPDVSLKGIDNYAKGVARLFASNARCEVVRCDLDDDDTVRVEWRLSGGVKVGPGLEVKPYVVYTDLKVRDGLVVFQEDRFSIPGWQILVGALFPWAPIPVPAPPVDELAKKA